MKYMVMALYLAFLLVVSRMKITINIDLADILKAISSLIRKADEED
ncbi:hypothetical protein [Bacteroides sp. 224]|nr:hypothetical protein [Bacteroides sp. 224]